MDQHTALITATSRVPAGSPSRGPRSSAQPSRIGRKARWDASLADQDTRPGPDIVGFEVRHAVARCWSKKAELVSPGIT